VSVINYVKTASTRQQSTDTKMILSLMNSSTAATLLNNVFTDTKYSRPYLAQNGTHYCHTNLAPVTS